jgi:predicted PurR-regulated permease PerM
LFGNCYSIKPLLWQDEILLMPNYFRLVIILFGLSLLVFVLYIGRNIIVPVYVASLFAWLMVPFSEMLEKKGVSRKMGAVLSILIIVLFIALLSWFFITQIRSVTSDLDVMQQKLLEFKQGVFDYARENFGLSESQLEGASQQLGENVKNFAMGFGSVASSLFIASILLPMSMYFFMSYRSFYREFLHKLTKRSDKPQIKETIEKETDVVRKYLLGILAVVAILSICNVTALTIIGVEHALLFGVVAALLNIIPVVGTIVGSLLPIVYTLIMKDSIAPAIIVALYFWFIQLLESGLITPNIVGKRMGVNPYAVLLAIFIGGAVWGPVGMVLFIPLTAQLKELCTVVEPLKPFGFVLSDPEEDEKTMFDSIKEWWKKVSGK